MSRSAVIVSKQRKKIRPITLEQVHNELLELKSILFGYIAERQNEDCDSEGEYRPEFVEKMLKYSKQKPTHIFKDPKSFLKKMTQGL